MGRPLFWGVLACEIGLVASLGPWSDLSIPGHATWFVSLALAAGLAYLLAVVLFEKVPTASRPAVFWIAAVILRVVALPMEPGDDFWRYQWEGRMQAEVPEYSPYLHPPDAPLLEPFRDPSWLKINHADHATIYPPGAALLFDALARVSHSPLWFKGAFAFFDLITIYLLVRINTGSGRYRASAWYAWNPAVLYAFAGGGHYDSVMVATLIAAVWALRRANPLDQASPAIGWTLLSALFLGLSISLKIVPVVLVPVWVLALIEADRRGQAKDWPRRLWLPLATVIISLGLPWLVSWPYGGPAVVLGPLTQFVDVSRFNDLIWWGIDLLWENPTGNNRRYRLVMMFAALMTAWFLRRDWRRSALWVLAVVIVLSPVMHLWYLAWILPLAAWRRAYPWFILSLTLFISLLVWNRGPGWAATDLTLAMRALIILPPILALIYVDWRHAVSPPDERLHPRL